VVFGQVTQKFKQFIFSEFLVEFGGKQNIASLNFFSNRFEDF